MAKVASSIYGKRKLKPVGANDGDLERKLSDVEGYLRDCVSDLSEHSSYRLAPVGPHRSDSNASPWELIRVNPSSGALKISLVSPSDAGSGTEFYVKNVTASTNTVTIEPVSGNIDGASSYSITTAYGSVRLCSDGSDYWVI